MKRWPLRDSGCCTPSALGPWLSQGETENDSAPQIEIHPQGGLLDNYSPGGTLEIVISPNWTKPPVLLTEMPIGNRRAM